MTSQSPNTPAPVYDHNNEVSLIEFSFDAKHLRTVLLSASEMETPLTLIVSQTDIVARTGTNLWIEADIPPNHISGRARETAFAMQVELGAFAPISVAAREGLATISVFDSTSDTPGKFLLTVGSFKVIWPYSIDHTDALWISEPKVTDNHKDLSQGVSFNPADLSAALLLASPFADDKSKGYGTVEISNGAATSASTTAMRTVTHTNGLGPDLQLEKRHVPVISRALQSIGTHSVDATSQEDGQVFSAPGLRMFVPRPAFTQPLAAPSAPEASFKVEGHEFLECVYIIGAQRRNQSDANIRIGEIIHDKKFELSIPVNGGDASIKCGYSDRTNYTVATEPTPIEMSLSIKKLKSLSPDNGRSIQLDFTPKSMVVHQSTGEHTFATSIGKIRG